MSGIEDLLRPVRLDNDDSDLPILMVGVIVNDAPLRVTVPAIDGGRLAIPAFGTLPDESAPGDEVRVMHDEHGGLVVIAWRPS